MASAVLAVAMLSLGVTAAASAAPGGGTTLGAWSFKDGTAPAGYSFLGRACLTEAVLPSPRTCEPFEPTDRLLTPGPVPAQSATHDSGWLELTAQTTGTGYNGVAGSLLYDNPLPASAGLVVTFDQVQYGGDGADGIAFFLTDGTYNLTAAGGSGGSLGYAQRGTSDNPAPGGISPGIAGGYLGVGLDAYGNFSNDKEARGRGCVPRATQAVSALTPNAVSLRGPGHLATESPVPGDTYPATDWVNGYCLLASTNLSDPTVQSTLALPPGASLRSTSATAPDDTLGTTTTMQRRVQVSIAPQPANSVTGPAVTVSVDFGNGSWVQVLSATMPEPAPPTYKFGFSASTGGSSDVHLVRNVHVDTQTPLAALTVTKQVPAAGVRAAGYLVGESIPYQYVVFNTGGDPVTALDIDDASLDATATCPTTVLAPGASTVCTGAHVVTAQDLEDAVAATTPGQPLVYSLPATAHGIAAGSALVSPPSTAPVVLKAPRGSITAIATLDDTDHDGLADVGETVHWSYEVAGDPVVDLSGVTVQTPSGPLAACRTFPLAHGTVHLCDDPSFTTVVTAADVAIGSVSTTAWARGIDVDLTVVTTAPSTASVTLAPAVVLAPAPPSPSPSAPPSPSPSATPAPSPTASPTPTSNPTPVAAPLPAVVPAAAPAAPGQPAKGLAQTGADLRLALLGAGALLLGAAAVTVSRGRRA